jgi:hypothetical protein
MDERGISFDFSAEVRNFDLFGWGGGSMLVLGFTSTISFGHGGAVPGVKRPQNEFDH